jgi:hypothetical protein
LLSNGSVGKREKNGDGFVFTLYLCYLRKFWGEEKGLIGKGLELDHGRREPNDPAWTQGELPRNTLLEQSGTGFGCAMLMGRKQLSNTGSRKILRL